MMNQRDNLISLLKRKGYDYVPVSFDLCPSLEAEFERQTGKDRKEYWAHFNMPWENINTLYFKPTATEEEFRKFHRPLKEGTNIDACGVAHEPGSEAAKHMTYMVCPMRSFTEMDQFKAYPYPTCDLSEITEAKKQVEKIHSKGLAAVGNMQCTIWETAWYMRGMEELMMDMMCEEETAEYHLNRITELNTKRACAYAEAGADILYLGDDIGMQKSIMMSKELYRAHIKPRLKNLIAEVRKVNPDITIFYHSCGYVTPFIPDFIDVGIDVLNPVQPECMNFEEIISEYRGAISFNGTIGTQSVMPFGTPDDVRKEVKKNLDLAGDKGGLFCAPTHLLEPEVPWENIIAYVEACKNYK